ncbi:MAG: hypothetical protein OWU84_02725 [Firmicutes bacterium]|nr:hypothetical protein [Bacillota bacterium]
MRMVRWLILVIFPAWLMCWQHPRQYTPTFAIAYADTHWNWARDDGRPGPVVRNGRLRVLPTTPGPGWFQPAYQCAEFVARSLHAGHVPIPLVAPANPRWPVMVNVDRLAYFLCTRGWATPISGSQVRPGDIALFRYPHWGTPASPNVWSHTAFIVGIHPLLLDAHNRSAYHVHWKSLARAAVQWEFLRIHPTVPPRVSWRPHQEVAIAWRDLWTSRGSHLYWGQLFFVNHARLYRVWLEGVRGSVPALALARIGPSPSLLWKGQRRVILGSLGNSHCMIATAHSPIPVWTGHPQVQIIPRRCPAWSPMPPRPVRITGHAALEPVPAAAQFPKAWAPQGAETVWVATVLWRHRAWAQVEWRGAKEGVAYLPLRDVAPITAPVARLTHPLALMASNGEILVVHPPTALVYCHHRYAYAGAWLHAIRCSQSGPHCPGRTPACPTTWPLAS